MRSEDARPLVDTLCALEGKLAAHHQPMNARSSVRMCSIKAADAKLAAHYKQMNERLMNEM